MTEKLIEIPDDFKENLLDQYRTQMAHQTDHMACYNSDGQIVCNFRDLSIILGIVSSYEIDRDNIDLATIETALGQIGGELTFKDVTEIERKHLSVTMPYAMVINPPTDMYSNFSSGVLFQVVLTHMNIKTIKPISTPSNEDILNEILETLKPLLETYTEVQEILNSDKSLFDRINKSLKILNAIGEDNEDNI